MKACHTHNNDSFRSGIYSNVTFEWSAKTYDYNSHPSFRKPGTHRLYIEYSDRDVTVETQVPLVDLNSFISAVGGGLGLFLGFSIIDTMTYMYQWIFRSTEGGQ